MGRQFVYYGLKDQNYEPTSQEFLILKEMKWVNGIVGCFRWHFFYCCSSHTVIASGPASTMQSSCKLPGLRGKKGILCGKAKQNKKSNINNCLCRNLSVGHKVNPQGPRNIHAINYFQEF